jgi:hypothetical protein
VGGGARPPPPPPPPTHTHHVHLLQAVKDNLGLLAPPDVIDATQDKNLQAQRRSMWWKHKQASGTLSRPA